MDTAKYAIMSGVNKTSSMTFDYGFLIGAVVCIIVMIAYKIYFWSGIDTAYHKKKDKL